MCVCVCIKGKSDKKKLAVGQKGMRERGVFSPMTGAKEYYHLFQSPFARLKLWVGELFEHWSFATF